MVFMTIFLYEKSCDRLCLLDFNEWNCIIIFLYGTIKLIIMIIIISIVIVVVVVVVVVVVDCVCSLLYHKSS